MNQPNLKSSTAIVVMSVIAGAAALLFLFWMADFVHIFGRIVIGIIRFVLNLFRGVGG